MKVGVSAHVALPGSRQRPQSSESRLGFLPGSGIGIREPKAGPCLSLEHIAFSGQGPTVRRAHAGAERAAASAAGAHAVAEEAAAAARRCFRDPSGLPPRALSGALLARWAGACG